MDPDPTPFFSDFKDANLFFIFHNLPAGTLSEVLKIYFFAKIFAIITISVRSTPL